MHQWIRSARLFANLTQAQLGEALGVTKANVSAWENGHHEASLAQVTKIAELTRYPEPLGDYAIPASPQAPSSWSGWPFKKIDPKKIRGLSEDEAIAIEAAFIVAASHIGIDIKK